MKIAFIFRISEFYRSGSHQNILSHHYST